MENGNEKHTEGRRCPAGRVLMIVICAVTALVLICSVLAVYFSFSALDRIKGVDEQLGSMLGSQDVAQEDDVTIGDRYKVRSTAAISDAYRSGDTSKLSAVEKETLDMASALIDGIIREDMSDADKEQAVYDWLINNTKIYDEQLVALPSEADTYDNPYCMLKYKEGVCVGYATTMRLLMQMLGIDCMVVHSSDLSHTWDLVRLDGEWYHTDVYSDINGTPYANFNMNDALAYRMHTWDQSFFPAATGIKHNYCYEHREKLKDVYELPALVKSKLDGQGSAFSVALDEGIQDAAEAVMSAISERLYGNEELSNYSIEDVIIDDGGAQLLFVFIAYSGPQEGDTAVDEEKLEQALDKAFGEQTAEPAEDGADDFEEMISSEQAVG